MIELKWRHARRGFTIACLGVSSSAVSSIDRKSSKASYSTIDSSSPSSSYSKPLESGVLDARNVGCCYVLMNFGPFIDRYFSMLLATGSIPLKWQLPASDIGLAESKPADWAELSARVEPADSLHTSSLLLCLFELESGYSNLFLSKSSLEGKFRAECLNAAMHFGEGMYRTEEWVLPTTSFEVWSGLSNSSSFSEGTAPLFLPLFLSARMIGCSGLKFDEYKRGEACGETFGLNDALCNSDGDFGTCFSNNR